MAGLIALIISCPLITDGGLESLSQDLRHLVLLYTITLNFYS